MCNAWEVKQINSIADLADVQMDWLLEDYDIADLYDLYFNVPDTDTQLDLTNCSPFRAKFGLVVHGRLFVKEVTLLACGDRVFVCKDEIDRIS